MLTVQTREGSIKQLADEKKLPVLIEPGNPFALMQRAFITVGKDEPSFTTQMVGPDEPHFLSDTQMGRISERRLESAMADLRLRPDNPHVLNNAGLTFLNAGQLDEAERLFRKALDIAPHLLAAKASLAKAYMLSAHLDKALSIYEEIIRTDPQNLVALMNMAQLHVLNGSPDDAEKLLSEVIKLDEDNVSARNNRGVVNLIRSRIHEAIADFRGAARINVRDATAHNNLGVAYALTGSVKRASKAFKTALTINSLHDSATKNLARLYLSNKEADAAVFLLTEFLQHSEEDIESRSLLATAYFLAEKYDLSLRQLNIALPIAETKQETKRVAEILNNLGVVCEARQELEESLMFLKRAIAIEPGALLPRLNMIRVFFGKNDLNHAREALEECLRMAPTDTTVLTLMGAYYARQEEYSRSLEFLEQAIETDPRNALPYGWLTVVLGEAFGNYAAVIQRLEPVIIYHPHEKLLLNNLAYSYLMLDNTQLARRILDRIDPWDYDSYVTATRGLLLIKEGNVQEGRRLYNLAARLAKTNELKNLVQQKKNIELARYTWQTGNRGAAIRLLEDAISVHTIEPRYRRQAINLLHDWRRQVSN